MGLTFINNSFVTNHYKQKQNITKPEIMNNQKFRILSLFLLVAIAFTACNEDDPFNNIDQPEEIQADNSWIDGEIESNDEIWYRIKCDAGATNVFVEWAEKDNHGESRTYNGDIMVSAFQLDGITPYFEDKDNGFGDKSKSLALANNETDVLVKVVLGETLTAGTYAIRATFTSDIAVEYIDLEIGNTWTEGTIVADQTIGYKVKYSGSKKLMVVWAEVESPEEGYTADVMVSVFDSEAITPYKDVEKGKDMLNKNNSHTDDPKYIQTLEEEKNFKIHVAVNNATPGTYAIKVVEAE